MSDFFGNLAARSLQPDPTGAPVLQPRLPALFEPPAGAELSGAPGLAPPAERTVPAPAPHQGHGADLPPDPQQPTQRSTILSEEPTPTRRPFPEREPPAPLGPSPPESFAVSPERTILTRFEREVVVGEQSIPKTEAAVPQPAGQDSQREPASNPGEESSRNPSGRAQRTAEAAVRENPVERIIHPQVTIVPLQASEPKDLAVPASIPQALRPPEPAPQAESLRDATVRIHIGRIEVRAVNSPPTVQAVRPAPRPHGPKLTLDDYLRQRNEGKR